MKQMYAVISYRDFEIRVLCAEKDLSWFILELDALNPDSPGDRLVASGFDLQTPYASGETAIEAGHAEGRRIVDEKLRLPDGHA
ncbi:hypothetical protein J8I26_17175 [Herbaspirillum sp. LeCh32-8]|uniref:hypothetical protein n=1 Tax=Herbaspirillum sp. LeCh32-8 TaxID=2821356 RepID=UPI001AE94654|nr:hypothetical protein [Herbaspirillum sp. LeCh32-8]MBP0599846.1 hypothetical protein [Herbaspirillum sp. LeCh32-8]